MNPLQKPTCKQQSRMDRNNHDPQWITEKKVGKGLCPPPITDSGTSCPSTEGTAGLYNNFLTHKKSTQNETVDFNLRSESL